MRLVLSVSLLAFAGFASASDPVGVFSGEVRIGTSDPHAFDVHANIGSTETVSIAGGYSLELAVSSFNKSIARLKDSAGNVLHTATFDGPVEQRPTFIYQVCDGGVQFVSPARADLPGCSG